MIKKFAIYYISTFFMCVLSLQAVFLDDHQPYHNFLTRCPRCFDGARDFLTRIDNTAAWITARTHVINNHSQAENLLRSYFSAEQNIEDLMRQTLTSPSIARLYRGLDGNYQLALARNFTSNIGVFRQPTGNQQSTNTVWMELEILSGEINRIKTCFPGKPH